MILTLLTCGILILLLVVSISVYRKKHTTHAQTPVEIIATGIAERVTNILSSTPTPLAVLKSIYYDRLYVGKTLTLDSSLKAMLTNVLFGFPIDPLIVSSFKYFDIDGNPFEEVVFDKIGAKNYIMMHDEFEGVNYFLNRVMTNGVQTGETPPMVDQDVITLTEDGVDYEYQDFSGLMNVTMRDSKGNILNDRLIRVYSRELRSDDDEYLVTIMDSPNAIEYYIGFQISIHQLEDI
jgi:hypothetical protein